MTCDHDWTLKFPLINEGEPFEIRPITIDLSISRSEYDYCRVKIPWEVGEEIKPYLRYSNMPLSKKHPVDVCYNGEKVHRLLFKPNNVEFRRDFSFITLKDMHKTLAEGTIDIQQSSASLEDIYTKVVTRHLPPVNDPTSDEPPENRRLIEGIKFTYSDNQIRSFVSSRYNTPIDKASYSEDYEPYNPNEQTQAIADGRFSIDFNNISPERAIQKLNEKFRIQTWFNSVGELIVGNPENRGVSHIAASDDDRVWRYKEPKVNAGRNQVQKVIVEGSWIDEPGLDLEPTEWFNNGGTNDVKSIGLAARTDIDNGKTFVMKDSRVKRQMLPDIAEKALKMRLKDQSFGTTEIDPALSGNEWSEIVDLRPGDKLQMIPDDRFFDDPDKNSGYIGDPDFNRREACGNIINNEVYYVRNVNHKIGDSGKWGVEVSLGMDPNVDLESRLTYFNPNADEYVAEREINEDGELKEASWQDGFAETI